MSLRGSLASTARVAGTGPPGRIDLAPLAVASAAALLLLAIRYSMVLGDGAAYAGTIAGDHLVERSIHIGYYAFMWLLARLLAPLDLPLDSLMIAANALLMAAALLVAWRLFERLGASRTVAAVGTLTLLMTGNVLQQGSSAEVYALQLALLAGALLLFFERRRWLAGHLFGLVLLVSPLSVLAAGPFAWQCLRERSARPLLPVAAAALLTFAPVFACVWHEYLYGTRGLLTAGLHRAVGPSILAYNAFALVQGFHWMAPFLLLGFLRANAHGWRGLAALALLGQLPLLLTMKEEGVFVLPAYPFLALVAADAAVDTLGRLPRVAARVAWGALAILYFGTAWFLWIEPQPREPRDRLARLLDSAPTGSAVVTSWAYTCTVPFYFRMWGHPGEPPRALPIEHATAAEIRRAIAESPIVYLIDDVQATPRRYRLWSTTLLRGRHPQPLLERVWALDAAIRATPLTPLRGTPVIYRLTRPFAAEGPSSPGRQGP